MAYRLQSRDLTDPSQRYRAGWLSGNALNSYSENLHFESIQEKLATLSKAPRAIPEPPPQANTVIILGFGHNHFLSNHSPFIIQQTSYHMTPYILHNLLTAL
jgi:hypothetical protein